MVNFLFVAETSVTDKGIVAVIVVIPPPEPAPWAITFNIYLLNCYCKSHITYHKLYLLHWLKTDSLIMYI